MRLDLYLVQQGFAPTRTRAANIIRLGGVTVDGRLVDKPAYDVATGADVVVRDVVEYASLGGLKLAHALQRFDLHPAGRAVDIGASNGGFTHCLLLHGAAHVYAVDVGECALPDYLAEDSRVTPMPRTNARNLTLGDVGGEVDWVVVDVSFISVRLLLPVVYRLLRQGGSAVILVKPQFEVGPSRLTKTGIVREEKYRLGALEDVCTDARTLGFAVHGHTPVPLLFADKNVEYLVYLRK